MIRRYREWLSCLKWSIVGLIPLMQRVDRPLSVLRINLWPFGREDWVFQMRDGLVLEVPGDYHFQSIVESILLDAYSWRESESSFVIDIGASIGDFTAAAARRPGRVVYAFEKDGPLRAKLLSNVRLNRLQNVIVSPGAADSTGLKNLISGSGQVHGVFLKMDCEGCEYEVIAGLSIQDLSPVSEIHMEVHTVGPIMSPELLAVELRRLGFIVELTRLHGCPYIHAVRDARVQRTQ